MKRALLSPTHLNKVACTLLGQITCCGVDLIQISGLIQNKEDNIKIYLGKIYIFY